MKLLSISVLLALPPFILASVGGHCAPDWFLNCICLDEGVCRSYGGTPNPGSPGNWPCPDDPNNVMACYVAPCPEIGGGTGCGWRDLCSGLVLSGKSNLPC